MKIVRNMLNSNTLAKIYSEQLKFRTEEEKGIISKYFVDVAFQLIGTICVAELLDVMHKTRLKSLNKKKKK